MGKKSGISLNILIYSLLAVIVFCMVYLTFYGKGGIIERRVIEQEISSLEMEIRELEKEKDRVMWELEISKHNLKYIEGFARELGYKNEGEILFRFIKKRSIDAESSE